MKIIKFISWSEEYAYLSNFFPVKFSIEGKEWPSIEHYFQAQKTVDVNWQERIRLSGSAKEARRLGRQVPLVSLWAQKKVEVMRTGLKAKFEQNPELKEKLIATGNAVLIEDAPWDAFWGSGKNDTGKNMLGQLLMEIRRVK